MEENAMRDNDILRKIEDNSLALQAMCVCMVAVQLLKCRPFGKKGQCGMELFLKVVFFCGHVVGASSNQKFDKKSLSWK